MFLYLSAHSDYICHTLFPSNHSLAAMMQLPIKTVAIYFVDWDLISLSLGVIEDFQVIAYTAAFFFFFNSVIRFTCILHSELNCPVLKVFSLFLKLSLLPTVFPDYLLSNSAIQLQMPAIDCLSGCNTSLFCSDLIFFPPFLPSRWL